MEFFDEDSDSEWSEDDQELIGLFNNQKFDTIKELIEDARNNYNFDFYAFQKLHKLDQYGCIRLINYIRSEIANKTNPETLVLSLLPQLLFLKDDKYYKPVLENDSLLFCSFELDKNDNTNTDNCNDDEKCNQKIDESTNNQSDFCKISNKISQLTQFIETESITTHALQQENNCLVEMNQELNHQINEMKKTFHRVVLDEDQLRENENVNDEKDIDIDRYYFDSYSRISVHEMMLRDKIRTNAYKDFILSTGNMEMFKDKIVMDIGCGTGVLSIFAAKAGAKHVIAIDMSDIAKKAEIIIKNNGFHNKITVIQNKLEDIKSLPHGIEKVDVIISEWMGYFLLYESMLSSVLFARDKWNINQIFPNNAALYMAGFDYDSMHLKFWQKECYGIDMSAMYNRPRPISEPLIIDIEIEYIHTQSVCFKKLDMHTAKDKDLDFTSKFDLIGTKDGAVIDAVVVWFDCVFENGKNVICLSTSPEKEVTHWYSTVFLLSERWELNKLECIHVELNAVRCEENSREYTIFIALSRDKDSKQMRQVYYLNGC